jgi:hypothetical protein
MLLKIKFIPHLLICWLIAALPLSATAGPIAVEALPIPLVADLPSIKTVGKLRYLGGLKLRSSDNHFGGFSSLGVSADGERMVSISDKGRRLAADLLYDNKGRLSGIANPALDTLSDLEGRALTGKRQSDAEAMSPGVDGEIIVAFERDHRLWSYRPAETRPRPLQAPDELARMPSNGGIEALTLLNDGALLAISEGPKGASDAVAWVSDENGWSVMTYATADGFRVTGAATLAGGDVLVLERRYTLRDGVAVRLRRLNAITIAPGAGLQAELIAEFRPPLTVDNFEGIETRRDTHGRTLVYIVSDDNFNPLQQTLLLMFELME